MSTQKITVDATVSADRKKVWDYWTKPEHIEKWNFASDDWQCPKAENDLRVGGKYFARMEAKDGSFGFDFEAVYDEVINQKQLIYTLTDGRQVKTIFQDAGNETKIITNFDPDTENPTDMQKQGWQAIMNNFKKYVEADSQD